jgi:hypothetical protein
MALEIVVVSVLAGIILGLRFKVMILVPAITLAMLFAVVVGVARADPFWSILLTIILLGSAVQVGYLAGIVMRAAISSICAPTTGGRN